MRFMPMLNAQQAESARQQAESSRQMMTLMAGMLKAQPAPVSQPFNDKLMEILLAKAFQPAAPATDMSKIIDALADLRRGDDAPESKDDIFSSVIKALPAFMPVIANMMQPKQAIAIAPSHVARAARPITQVQTSAPATEVVPTTEVTDVADAQPQINKQVLAAFLPQIVALAESGQKAVDAAAQVSAALGSQSAELTELLSRDDWLAVLIDAHTPVMKHTRWFTELRNSILRPTSHTP
jgi:hypothetical protein